jgi:hypothetical protein
VSHYRIFGCLERLVSTPNFGDELCVLAMPLIGNFGRLLVFCTERRIMALENVFYRSLVDLGASPEAAEKVVDLLQGEVSMTAKNHVLEATAPQFAQLSIQIARLDARIEGRDWSFNRKVQIFGAAASLAAFISALIAILKAFGKI